MYKWRKKTSSQVWKPCNKEKTFYDNHNILKPDEPKDKWTPKWFQLIIYFYTKKNTQFFCWFFSLTVDVLNHKLFFVLNELLNFSLSLAWSYQQQNNNTRKLTGIPNILEKRKDVVNTENLFQNNIFLTNLMAWTSKILKNK